MFSFFKKKPKDTPVVDNGAESKTVDDKSAVPAAAKEEGATAAEHKPSWFDRIRGDTEPAAPPPKPVEPAPVAAPPQPLEQKTSWLDRFKGAPSAAAPEPLPEPQPEPVLPPSPPPLPSRFRSEPQAPVPPIETEEEIVPAAAPSAEQKQSWLNRLKTGLSKTSSSLTTLFVGAKIDDDLYEELESALLVADAGVDATRFLLDGLKKKVKDEKLTDASQVKAALRTLLIDLLAPLQKPMVLGRHQPTVMMIAGVNGAGKTTTIGKLAKHLQAHEQSVLLAAGDTFRAAAREQLTIWGERNNVTVISQESGDPAAVAFDAVQSARARGIDVVMVDTAGRLPTQLHLMEELKKIRRVIGKGMESAPHEVLLVIDGNTGQNALAQVKAFDDALSLTGLVVTKLDGTAKGGVLAAIAKTRPVPVYFIGVGEKIEDLQPFDASEFVDALLS